VSDLVLLVEDDEDDALFLMNALKRDHFPYRVVTVRDGAKAIELLESSAELPRLVILDLKMPKIGGLEVLKRLRASERLRETRVVVLSASMERHDRETAEGLSVLQFLRKPTDTAQYADVARRIGGAAKGA
jgi:two-component system response regulator